MISSHFPPLRTGRLTLKSDVYSFGVVLLEILSGSSAVDRFSNGRLGNLADHAKPYLSNKLQLPRLIDERLGTDLCLEEAQEFAEIIIQCLNPEAKSRPTMTQVLSSLEQLEENWGNCRLAAQRSSYLTFTASKRNIMS